MHYLPEKIKELKRFLHYKEGNMHSTVNELSDADAIRLIHILREDIENMESFIGILSTNLINKEHQSKRFYNKLMLIERRITAL